MERTWEMFAADVEIAFRVAQVLARRHGTAGHGGHRRRRTGRASSAARYRRRQTS
jgi:hypothetical protein